MTGPNPDAELDEALGVAQLPPALPGPTDHELAGRLVTTWRGIQGSYVDQAAADEALVAWFAEALATERMRATARVLATQAVAGTAPASAAPNPLVLACRIVMGATEEHARKIAHEFEAGEVPQVWADRITRARELIEQSR